eukprot:1161889-Pelagomonas_calceolata.AAC.3
MASLDHECHLRQRASEHSLYQAHDNCFCIAASAYSALLDTHSIRRMTTAFALQPRLSLDHECHLQQRASRHSLYQAHDDCLCVAAMAN